ncbi:MAG: hypothetical protein ACXVAX_02830 [Pseudobdellovibrio sp.]
MKKMRIVFLTLSVLFFHACGQPAGNAPSQPPAPPAPLTPYDSLIKYGETKVTSGGWTVSVDTTDPVQTTSLANGWVVEAVHE